MKLLGVGDQSRCYSALKWLTFSQRTENITWFLNQTLREVKKIGPPEIPLRFEDAYLGQVSTKKFQVKVFSWDVFFNKKKRLLWSLTSLYWYTYVSTKIYTFLITSRLELLSGNEHIIFDPGTRTFRAGLDFPGLGTSPKTDISNSPYRSIIRNILTPKRSYF